METTWKPTLRIQLMPQAAPMAQSRLFAPAAILEGPAPCAHVPMAEGDQLTFSGNAETLCQLCGMVIR